MPPVKPDALSNLGRCEGEVSPKFGENCFHAPIFPKVSMLSSWFFKPEGKKGKKNERLADPTGKRGEFDVRNAGWYVQDEKANSYPSYFRRCETGFLCEVGVGSVMLASNEDCEVLWWFCCVLAD